MDQDLHTKDQITKKYSYQKQEGKSGRISVSAEAYGKFNVKGNFKAKIIKKNANQVSRIKTRMSQAFMFSALDEKEIEIVINAMQESTYQ